MKSDGKGNKWHTDPTDAQQHQSIGISGWPIMSSQRIPDPGTAPPLGVADSPLHTHTYASAHPGDSGAAQVNPYMYHFNLSFSQGRLYKTSNSCCRFTDTNMASPLFAVLWKRTDFTLLWLTAYLNKYGFKASQCSHCYLWFKTSSFTVYFKLFVWQTEQKKKNSTNLLIRSTRRKTLQ